MEEDEMEVIDNKTLINNKLSKFRVFPEDMLVGLGILFLFLGFGIFFIPIYSFETIDLFNAIIYLFLSISVITISCGMFFMSSVLKYLRKIIKINEEKKK